MLVIFDFHGVLSLNTGTSGIKSIELGNKSAKNQLKINDIKNSLRKYKNNLSWYHAMKTSEIDPYIMMPSLDDIIIFIENFKETPFGIASMGEDENFVYDMMNYCFEYLGKKSPFQRNSIIGFQSFKDFHIKSTSIYDKLPHIDLISRRLSLNAKYIILIDNDDNVLSNMSKKGINCIKVDEYFKFNY